MADITVVGLGPGSFGCLTVATLEKLKTAECLFLRTIKHPVVSRLLEEDLVKARSFDHYYEKYESFDRVYEEIANALIEEAAKGPVVYAVPGHPLVAEDSVARLQAKANNGGFTVDIIPAMSFLDPLFQVVNYDPINGLKIIDALQMDRQFPQPGVANVVVQVYSSLIAQELKISLMEYYPDEYPVTVVRAVGIQDEERVLEIPLYELDRLPWIDYLTSVFIPPLSDRSVEPVKYPVDPLVRIMQRLREPEGCPWDREQTHDSLKKYLVEETYEVLDAIDEGNMNKICEELGDLLLQIAFHAQLADEAGFFDMNDIIEGISQKLIRRHPHVFGDVRVKDSAEVNYNWEQIKATEKKDEGKGKSLLDSVPGAMPALLKAEKLQKKAAKVGFDWPDYKGALEKVHEELKELEEAIDMNSPSKIKEELGDIFFALVNVARFLKVDPESVLAATNNKFIKRFKVMEDKALEANQDITEMTLEQLDQLWEEAKIILKR